MVTLENHNKFVTVSESLRSSSEHTFEEMYKMDLMEEHEAMTKSRAVYLETVRKLNKERKIVMDTFYVDFKRCVERYQQLRRYNLWICFL